MTFKFKNVYLEEVSTICGPFEKRGPLGKYFDKSYQDFYCGEESWELAEIKLVKDALAMLLKKSGYKKEEIDLVIGGDLLNQITPSSYGSNGVGNAFIGIYGACSTNTLGLIIASCLIDKGYINNSICLTSSHNLSAEKQFRYPSEYSSIKKKTATFTATGSTACLLTNNKNNIKVECATLGKVIDLHQNNPNNIGRAMAPSAIDTLLTHLKDTKRTVNDYDLIVTGDLGKYGKSIFKKYLENEENIILDNYNDCGVMLYDLSKQKEVNAGGSGPVCSALVTYGYLLQLLETKKYKRILVLATGALFSPTILNLKEDIYSICHAISLEAV